jgi:hypothetical protein
LTADAQARWFWYWASAPDVIGWWWSRPPQLVHTSPEEVPPLNLNTITRTIISAPASRRLPFLRSPAADRD